MTVADMLLPLVKAPERLATRLREIPQEAGVYLMRDGQDQILYIGKSKKLRSRIRSYFREAESSGRPRIALMVPQIVEIEFIVTDTEAEALALEANLIKQHQPHFNVLLKDDKKYPYLCITWSEDYPSIFITRKRRLGNPRDRYYGPYVDTYLLRSTLRLVKRLFPLRQRRQPLFKDRPCLNYDIGRCPGICQQLVTPEEYRKTLQQVAMVFQGRTQELVDFLTAQMSRCATALRFEQAAALRDQIQSLKTLGADQKVQLPDDTVSRDAIALAADDRRACIQLFQVRAGKLVGRLGFVAEAQEIEPGAILQRVLEEHYQGADAVEIPAEILVQYPLPDADLLIDVLGDRRGRKVSLVVPQRQLKAELIELVARNAGYELARTQQFADRNARALEDLAALLDLPALPHRLEGYDISHIQGSDAVASRVVFVDGLPAKQHYRHYKIQDPRVTLGRSDDFASLAEVIGRRFRPYVQDPNLRRLGNPDWPDVVMIDGGKGQLSTVVAVLGQMDLLEDVRVISLAKQREEVFLPGESLPLATVADQPGLELLRRLRDEAHRFAITFHRQQRRDRLRRSTLDTIPGLGHQRQKQLLATFRSLDHIQLATPAQLATAPGIGPQLAQQIYTYFHPYAEEATPESLEDQEPLGV